MRKILALTLLSYLLTFWAPFVVFAREYNSAAEECYWESTNCEGVTDAELDAIQAAGGFEAGTAEELANALEAPKMCPFGIDSGRGIPYGTFTEAAKTQTYKAFYSTYTLEMSEAQCGEETSASAENACKEALVNKCGEEGSYNSKYLEKGDCSAAGLVVTEITEIIAPNTELDDKNKIVTTYAGLCCFAGEVKDGKVVTCDDTRTLYTKAYADCSAVAVNCEKRQWVIGNSGIGIVKLMVKQIYVFGAFAVGSVAVSTMIFQGIKISVSGVSGDITESKTKILQALSGIVLLFLSGLILYTVNPDFFG